jgi:acetyl-CoA synthetase
MFRKLNGEITKKYDFKNLRVLGSVGEPIDSSSWLWYFKEIGKEKCPIVDTYWQTETGGIVISSLPGIGPFKPAFAGLPFPGVKVDILDEKGNSCKVGERGNLVILLPFSPGMLRGLYKKPEKYKKVYWGKYGENIYFTSDGAFRDENGLIRIVGRVDDIIKIAGHRISTGELEEAVNSHEKIIESAVVGVPDEIKGEVPVIFAIYKGKKEKEEIKKEILEIIRKRIGPIAPPKEIYLVEDLPRTRSGKIVRKILRELMLGEEIKDLSALANPESVDKIKKLIKK